MRQFSRSFCFLSFLLLALLPVCSTDRDSVYEPPAETLLIAPEQAMSRDHSPTLSMDAAVLAWVRVVPGPPDTSLILRWERPGTVDTIDTAAMQVVGLDISPDGERLAVVSSSPTARLHLWTGRTDPAEHSLDLPAGYTDLSGPFYADTNCVLFGAFAPDGQGVWSWNPLDDSLTPICTRFPDIDMQWLGESPGLSRTRTLLCFEIRAGGSQRQSIVCEVGSCTVLLTIDGLDPHFWSITPSEEDGILYREFDGTLRGLRISTGEQFYIQTDTRMFDISPDGRWLFTERTIPGLTLRDLRNLR